MRLETNWGAFALLALAFLCLGPVTRGDDADAVLIAKAKAKTLLALKGPDVTRDMPKAIGHARDTGKPLYVWVRTFRKDIADRLPPGVHVLAEEYHGYTTEHLVIKSHGSEYQLEQSKLSENVETIRKIVRPDQRSESKRPPIIDIARESEEPPLLTSVKCSPHCRCVPGNTCGCTKGEPCQCVGPPTIQAGSGIPIRVLSATADWHAPATNHTGPVMVGERIGFFI